MSFADHWTNIGAWKIKIVSNLPLAHTLKINVLIYINSGMHYLQEILYNWPLVQHLFRHLHHCGTMVIPNRSKIRPFQEILSRRYIQSWYIRHHFSLLDEILQPHANLQPTLGVLVYTWSKYSSSRWQYTNLSAAFEKRHEQDSFRKLFEEIDTGIDSGLLGKEWERDQYVELSVSWLGKKMLGICTIGVWNRMLKLITAFPIILPHS